jgi:hypothetical protein
MYKLRARFRHTPKKQSRTFPVDVSQIGAPLVRGFSVNAYSHLCWVLEGCGVNRRNWLLHDADAEWWSKLAESSHKHPL